MCMLFCTIGCGDNMCVVLHNMNSECDNVLQDMPHLPFLKTKPFWRINLCIGLRPGHDGTPGGS